MNINKIILSLTMITFIFGQTTDGPIDADAAGTVAFICSWNGANDNTLVAGNFSTMDIATYDVPDDGLGSGGDVISFDDIITVSDFDANYAFEITATKGTWTLPTNYNESAATSKKTNGSDTDYMIKAVVDVAEGGLTPPGEGAIVVNSYESYKALPTTGEVIIEGGSIASDNAHGVEDVQFHIDARVAMDWVFDIKGFYEINLLLTVASQ